MQQCVHLRFPWPASWPTRMRKKKKEEREKKKRRRRSAIRLTDKVPWHRLSTRLPIEDHWPWYHLQSSSIQVAACFCCWPIRLECHGGNSRLRRTWNSSKNSCEIYDGDRRRVAPSLYKETFVSLSVFENSLKGRVHSNGEARMFI